VGGGGAAGGEAGGGGGDMVVFGANVGGGVVMVSAAAANAVDDAVGVEEMAVAGEAGTCWEVDVPGAHRVQDDVAVDVV